MCGGRDRVRVYGGKARPRGPKTAYASIRVAFEGGEGRGVG